MKVWNSGKATAFNVRAGFDGNPGIFIHDRDMQPFEELESGKGYELVLTVVDGSASKCRIITEWTDADGQKQSKYYLGHLERTIYLFTYVKGGLVYTLDEQNHLAKTTVTAQ